MTIELYEAKLLSSGLSLEDGELLGYKHITAEEARARGKEFDKIDSLYIPYFDPLTNQPYRFREGLEEEQDYFRLRILKEKEESKKQSIIHKAAPPKEPPPYKQPSASSNFIYYPRTLEQHGLKWSEIVNDTTKPIYITEGELKAAKTCKVGLPCIAIAGIWNWQNKSGGIDMLPSLKIIRFKNRTVYIAFDSDMVDKPQIRLAMIKLAEKLISAGAKVFCITVPKKVKDAKTGLDDYFVHFEPTSNDILIRNFTEECMEKAELLESYKELHALNDRYTYIQEMAAIIDTEHGKPISKQNFKDNIENQSILRRYIDKDGKERVKEIDASKAFLKWPHRSSVEKVVYEPGEPVRTEALSDAGRMVSAFNCWTGWKAKPVEGDCTPFLDLVNYLCETSEPGTVDWFLKWLAYPIQHPGKKMATAVVLYGLEGAGKGSIGKVLEKIYGKHYRPLDNNTFQDKYTDWALKTSFLFADDLAEMRAKDLMSQLKVWVTEPTFPIREMYHSTFNVTNHMNIMLTTNDTKALKMGQDDRRFTIIQTPPYKADSIDPEFFTRYHRFVDDDEEGVSEGANNVMHYLLNYDLTGFNPHGSALKSSAKDTLKGAGSSDLNRFIRELLEAGTLSCDFTTPSDVLMLYRQDDLATTSARSKVNVQSVSNEFEACRFLKLLHRIRVDGKKLTFYAVKNTNKWAKASEQEAEEYVKNNYRAVEVVAAYTPPVSAYEEDF